MSSEKKLLLFARDPGGANVVIALVPQLRKEYQVAVYAKDVALKFFQTAGIQAKNIENDVKEISVPELEKFLVEQSVDMVITGTSADDSTEKYLWKAAEKLQIVSLAILDQWVNYGVRFSKFNVSELDSYKKEMSHDYLPTRICVMDSYAKKKMMEEGIAAESIAITGQPYLATFADEVKRISEEQRMEYRGRFVKDREKLIVFASEPICKTYGEEYHPWGYTESTIFSEFRNILSEIAEQEQCKVSVVVRPHPKEDMEQWKERLLNTSFVSFYLDRSVEQKLVMSSADLIVGMSSMFLLESVLCKKPVISLQIGLSSNWDNPFILQKIGLVDSAVTREEAYESLKAFVQGKQKPVTWDIPMDAVENIESLIRELTESKEVR